ncbi:hypothetical protein DENSPDRAFT_563398 [Dentipellis sp. KUC8613]|nr:hypothetical protein DENSPDRAFT_563398 [Dentipellis sp. KUC8613]
MDDQRKLPPIITSHLPQALLDELAFSIRGKLYPRDDPHFMERSRMFNGNIVNASKAVACPLDAYDVSRIIQFCTKHSLSPSIKAGGYGTAGWAINGDITVDLSLLHDVDIEAPQPGGSYVSLRDMVAAGGKGKSRAGAPVQDASGGTVGAKRRREAESDPATSPPVGMGIPTSVRVYDGASAAVAGFLHGEPLPSDPSGEAARQPPINRRRLDGLPDGHPGPAASPRPLADGERQISTDSQSSKQSSNSSGSDSVQRSTSTSGSLSTAGTTPPPLLPAAEPKTPAPARPSDPFGYMGGPGGMGGPGMGMPPFGNLGGLTGSLWGPVPNHPAVSASPVGAGRLEPVHAHAYVTFGAGVKQKEVDLYTAGHPLPAVAVDGTQGRVPYHVPFSAHPVGSSVMLLGGFGFLSRLYGLSIDNLVEVEMVLADGSIVIANEKEHPELWWGLRGAGPSLGVATRYKARAYPVPVVFAGNLIYRFHRATAPSLIKHFRDCVKGAPRELYANVLLTAGPADKDSLVVIQICYVGPKEKGEEYLHAISSWTGERCLLNEVHEKSMLNQQDSVAQVLRGKAGRQWFIRSALITSLPDDVIHKTVMEFADTPIGCTWLFELAGGAIADFEDTCVPKSQREATFTIAALHQWDMGVDDPACVETAEAWLQDTIRPVATGGPFPSFLGRHEIPARAMASFGAHWDRLRELKQKMDPKNVFRNSFWPLDASGEVVDPREHEPLTPP